MHGKLGPCREPDSKLSFKIDTSDGRTKAGSQRFEFGNGGQEGRTQGRNDIQIAYDIGESHRSETIPKLHIKAGETTEMEGCDDWMDIDDAGDKNAGFHKIK